MRSRGVWPPGPWRSRVPWEHCPRTLIPTRAPQLEDIRQAGVWGGEGRHPGVGSPSPQLPLCGDSTLSSSRTGVWNPPSLRHPPDGNGGRAQVKIPAVQPQTGDLTPLSLFPPDKGTMATRWP